MRTLFPIGCAALVAWGAFSWWTGRPVQTPPGVLVTGEPVQESCAARTVAQVKDYTLTAVATYALRARVLGTKRYWAQGHDLVPYDVALGWGRMSDQSVLDHLRIAQGNRFFFYRWQDAPPIPEREIVSHAANTHLIAASRPVARAIAGLRVAGGGGAVSALALGAV
jgi:hypothetical protein